MNVADALSLALREICARGQWDLAWSTVVAKAAKDLAEPAADVFAVRRRLERLAELYLHTRHDRTHTHTSMSALHPLRPQGFVVCITGGPRRTATRLGFHNQVSAL